MTNTNFIKIRAGLTKGLHPYQITSTGLKFSDEFMDRLTDVEEQFRSALIVPINEEIGLHNWAIKFIEHPTPHAKFFADIYTDNPDDFYKIVGIIKSRIEDIEFSYYYKGNIATYTHSQD
jgi:hypothetical protein